MSRQQQYYRDDVELTHTPPPQPTPGLPYHSTASSHFQPRPHSQNSPPGSERESFSQYDAPGGSTTFLNPSSPSPTPAPFGGGYEREGLVGGGLGTPGEDKDLMYGGYHGQGEQQQGGYRDIPYNPYLSSSAGVGSGGGVKAARYTPGLATRSRRRRRLICLSIIALLLLIAAAVIIPIYFKVIKPHSSSSSSSSSGSSGGSDNTSGTISPNPFSPTGALSGTDGSLIITNTTTNSTFTYKNPFGGSWYYDPLHPYALNAQAQSTTPPLNKTWNYGTDQIRGVNLGGWFVLEPFIAPALFQKYPSASDEWTLSVAMRADTGPGGGIGQIEDHYRTFITEEDFAQMAGAGLNWIRLPIPYWAIETYPSEPFLSKTCWPYILQALQWARKYGLRVNLDLHTAPGSQNGYNHSGKGGQINFMNGMMGVANGQRLLGYIRVITEFVSQEEWRDLVGIFGVINEVRVKVVGKDQMTSFYYQTHQMIREITGIGQGPIISIHDGFVDGGIANWTGFLQGSDRIALDTHPYFAFSGSPNNEPLSQQPIKACNAWANPFNTSQSAFGITLAGEFSNGINDCGLFLLGTGVGNSGTSYEKGGGNCDDWMIWEKWGDDVKSGLRDFAEASMDSLHGNWFWWTWKIGNDTTSGSVRAPLWSYQLGLQNGWMPTNPADSDGKCASAGLQNPVIAPTTYSSWQTGGAGAGTIAPTSVSQYGTFPPSAIANLNPPNAPVSLLPTYTATGAIPTLPPPTLTALVKGGKGGVSTSTISGGNGWKDGSDTTGAPTPVAGCSYPDPWDATSVVVPSTVCTGAGAVRRTAGAAA